MRDRFGRKASSTSGFTLVELLTGMTLFGFVAIFTNNLLQAPQPDFELQAAAHEIAAIVKQAGREATSRGVTTVIRADLEQQELVAYAEVNGSSSANDPTHHRFLIFDPDPALHSARQTDYEIARLRLPEGVVFAQGDQPAVDGLTKLPQSGNAPHAIVFLSRGRVLDAGSIRLMDAEGRNVLEAALLDLTGRVTIRKYLKSEDAPAGSGGFFAERLAGESSPTWAWY